MVSTKEVLETNRDTEQLRLHTALTIGWEHQDGIDPPGLLGKEVDHPFATHPGDGPINRAPSIAFFESMGVSPTWTYDTADTETKKIRWQLSEDDVATLQQNFRAARLGTSTEEIAR